MTEAFRLARQDEDRRWRRRRIIIAFEDNHGPIDDHIFVIGWRGQTLEIIGVEMRRWLLFGVQHQEPAPRIPIMRSMRIAAHIAPISARRIGTIGAPPAQGLAPRREQRPDPCDERIVRERPDELLIGRDRVLFDGDRISVGRRLVPQ